MLFVFRNIYFEFIPVLPFILIRLILIEGDAIVSIDILRVGTISSNYLSTFS